MYSDSVVMEAGVTQSHAPSAPSPSKKEASNTSLTLRWLNASIVDVFRGQGWDNWSRFRKIGSHYEMIAGQPLTTQEYQALKNG